MTGGSICPRVFWGLSFFHALREMKSLFHYAVCSVILQGEPLRAQWIVVDNFNDGALGAGGNAPSVEWSVASPGTTTAVPVNNGVQVTDQDTTTTFALSMTLTSFDTRFDADQSGSGVNDGLFSLAFDFVDQTPGGSDNFRILLDNIGVELRLNQGNVVGRGPENGVEGGAYTPGNPYSLNVVVNENAAGASVTYTLANGNVEDLPPQSYDVWLVNQQGEAVLALNNMPFRETEAAQDTLTFTGFHNGSTSVDMWLDDLRFHDGTAIDAVTVLGGSPPDGSGKPPGAPNPPALPAEGDVVLAVDMNNGSVPGAPTQSGHRGWFLFPDRNPGREVETTIKGVGVKLSKAGSEPLEIRSTNGSASRTMPGGSTNLSGLVADFVASRDAPLVLELSGLAAGEYVFRSTHLEPFTGSNLGFAQGASLTEAQWMYVSWNGTVQSAVACTALSNEGLGRTDLTDADIPRMAFVFTAQEHQPVEITFGGYYSSGGLTHILLNGFEIVEVAE